jgi:CRISPR associated protein Cas1
MAWRGLHVSRRTYLSLADNQIVAKQEETEARIPIEDVAWIVLDSPQITLSTALIAACMEAGVWSSPPTRLTPPAACCCRSIAITGKRKSPACKPTCRYR